MARRKKPRLAGSVSIAALTVFGVAVAAWTAWMIRQLLISTLVAAFIVVLFAPVKKLLLKWLGQRPRLVASILTATALLVIILPSAFILYLVVGEVVSSLLELKSAIGSQGIARLFDGNLPPIVLQSVHRLQSLVPIPTGVFEQRLSEMAQRIPKALGGLLGLSLRSAVSLLFVCLGLFYFFLDGERFVLFLRDISPLKPAHNRTLWNEFGDVVRAMLLGSAISVAVGAVMCVLGFWVIGVPKPLFWGTMTGLFTIAPGVGSALVFVPLSILLAIQGHVAQAAGVLLFCIVALVVVNDLLLRPLIVGQRLRLHPYLILLSMFGGVEAYGFAGLLLGPLAATLAVAALRLYRRDRLSLAKGPAPEGRHVAPLNSAPRKWKAVETNG